MQNTSFRRNVFLLLLLAALTFPVQAVASPLDLFDRVWSFVKSAWSESGSRIDPDGPANDEGSRIDPDGASQPETDSGSRIDPNG